MSMTLVQCKYSNYNSVNKHLLYNCQTHQDGPYWDINYQTPLCKFILIIKNSVT